MTTSYQEARSVLEPFRIVANLEDTANFLRSFTSDPYARAEETLQGARITLYGAKLGLLDRGIILDRHSAAWSISTTIENMVPAYEMGIHEMLMECEDPEEVCIPLYSMHVATCWDTMDEIIQNPRMCENCDSAYMFAYCLNQLGYFDYDSWDRMSDVMGWAMPRPEILWRTHYIDWDAFIDYLENSTYSDFVASFRMGFSETGTPFYDCDVERIYEESPMLSLDGIDEANAYWAIAKEMQEQSLKADKIVTENPAVLGEIVEILKDYLIEREEE